MTKNQIISIVHACACAYDANLRNTQVMFVYLDANNNTCFAEVRFRSHHFLHFTGLTLRKGLSANQFYNRILHGKLNPNDFSVSNPFLVQRKLKILPSIVNIDHNARMIGDYVGPHLELYTEKVAGTTSACLGFILKNDIYIPNTILNEDIRNISQHPPGKIFAIFKRTSTEHYYTKLTYFKKTYTFSNELFSPAILSKLDMQLFTSYIPS